MKISVLKVKLRRELKITPLYVHKHEKNLAEAIEAISRLPRVTALVLAGSLMGGEITESVKKVKENGNLIVISLNMPGSVTKYADLIITDPIQAGVLAVMAVADTAVFDIKKLGDNIKY